MDESVNDGSGMTVGNLAIPDWMLKRRARMQAVAAKRDSISDTAESAASHAEQPVPPEHAASLVAAEALPDGTVVDAEPADATEVDGVAPDDSPIELSAASAQDDLPYLLVTVPRKAPGKSAPTGPSKPAILPAVQADNPEQLQWHEVLRRRWLGKDALGSYAISMVMHIVAALLLSLVVFHEEIANLGINTLFAEQSDDLTGDALDDSAIFQIDTSGGQTGEDLDAMLSANAISTALGPSALQAPEVAGAVIGEGDGEGSKVGEGLSLGGFQMPEGGKGVVKKGSFAAWTVPEDPAPGEDYKIIIQVRYKSRNQKMPTGDISGSVIGTDKYRLMISPHTSEIIPEANQVVVNIPGAAARVRDTIRVYSAILRENQRLEIVF